MGKGKGKGGCGLFEAIGDTIQCIAGCICCLCVSGPLLIVIGIAFIVSAFSDGRSGRVDQFEMAVSNWNDGAVDNFNSGADNSWTYSVANTCGAQASNPLLQNSGAEELGSESDEQSTFAGYARVTYIDTTPPTSGNLVATDNGNSCRLAIEFMYKGASVGNVTVAQQRTTQLAITCQASTRRVNGRTITDDDPSACRSQCNSRGGTSSGSSTSNFVCTAREAPSEICVRVTPRASSFAIATQKLPDMNSGASGSGCFLSFGGGTWSDAQYETFTSAGPLSANIRVRHERDPYLYFLDISKGTLDFGLKTSEKLKIGFACLAIGIVLTAIICGACFCIVKFARSFATGNKAERPANAVGGALYDVSAKYGNYIPGGAAMGYPAGNQPVDGKPAEAGHYGGQPYNGDTSYDNGGYQGAPGGYQGAPGGYPGAQGGYQGAPAGYPGAQGAPVAPYATPPAGYGAPQGAPPPGYPTV